MSDDDDQAWLDALGGRAPPGDASRAALEGERLRTALRARAPANEVGLQREIGHETEARTAQLVARARNDAVIGPALAHRAARRKALRPAWSALAAAGIAGLVIALAWTWRPGTEVPVERSAPDTVYRITADDPPALRDEIAQALRGAGVSVVAYQRFGREGIDAELPRPVTSRVRAVLEHYRIPLPADGVLRVEIAPAARP
ncbi:MAG: hypothetical protein AB7G76_03900 [Steroidobacteraceae bacterium]